MMTLPWAAAQTEVSGNQISEAAVRADAASLADQRSFLHTR